MTTDPHHPVLVLGGTGTTGRRVAQRLRDRGVPVRIGSRAAAVPFDWTDPATWPAVVDGVGAVYLSFQPDLAFPGAAATVAAFAGTAVAAGARNLVLLSGRGEEGARAAELAVLDAGVDATVVRCAWFDQNFSESFLLEPVLHGELALPTGGAAEPFVDADDIADVAAAALTDPRHAGREYELTGPRLLTFDDVAAELSRATGRDVVHVPVTTAAYAAALRDLGLPVEFADLFEGVLDGRNAHLSDGVARALGREPRDFADFARDAAATGVWTPRP